MKKVWFVCVGNAGRSQMAQAFYERRGGEARSAGSRPETDIHQPVGEAMEEIGLDIWDRKPKPIRREDAEWADVVVTMGCGDRVRSFPARSTSTGTSLIPSVWLSKKCASCVR
jgi:arsenate reductase (thioredoxin)